MELDPLVISTFSRLIRTLLLEHNRVSLPGIGSFVAEDQSSKLLDGGRIISAPTREVNFSVRETWNDELLERAYATELEGAMLELEDGEDLSREELEEKNRKTQKLFLDQAKREVLFFSSEVERQLVSGRAFQFPGLGVMRMGKRRQDIGFEKDPDCELSPQGFGLEDISIKPLAKPSVLTEPYAPPKPPPLVAKPPYTPKEPVKEQRGKENKKGNKQKRFRWLYFFLWLFLIVVVLCLLVYFFRDDLRPWLERILYTPEERRILRML